MRNSGCPGELRVGVDYVVHSRPFRALPWKRTERDADGRPDWYTIYNRVFVGPIVQYGDGQYDWCPTAYHVERSSQRGQHGSCSVERQETPRVFKQENVRYKCVGIKGENRNPDETG